MNDIVCDVCFHHCVLSENALGRCRTRKNENGKNVCANYGRVTSLAMDPIEKKPLVQFYPGTQIVSVGSYGCNFACPFCQNSSISMANENTVQYQTISPKELANIVCTQENNLGIAFTYNEPLLNYEYILDTAKYLAGTDKKIVVVTNGSVEIPILEKLLKVVDAMNIDYKGDKDFYQELQGNEEAVRKCIEYAIPRCHVEVTSLIIPTKNDSIQWIEDTAKWLANCDPHTVWHLSRYFPRYKYQIEATPIDIIYSLQQVAKKYLPNVYTGNV